MRPLSTLAAAGLLLLTLRRWLFIAVALAPDEVEPAGQDGVLPSVLVVVAARDERQSLPGLLEALGRLDYPADRVRHVLVDDGSADGTRAVLESWTAGRRGARTLALPVSSGKAAALNAAVGAEPEGQLVAVFDADERPRPGALRALARRFEEPGVGAVSGRRRVREQAGGASAYAAFETLVHQLVTSRAKDRMGLAPPVLGSNCAYRRSALAAVGGFRPAALLEDSDLTVRLAAAGWRLRFARDAVSEHDAPATLSGYFRQHRRWARGFNDVAGERLLPLWRRSSLPLPLRLELTAFSLGYAERLLLAALGAAAAAGQTTPFARRVVLAALATPAAQVAVGLALDGATRRLWSRTFWLPVYLAVDVIAAAAGLAGALARRPQRWERRGTG